VSSRTPRASVLFATALTVVTIVWSRAAVGALDLSMPGVPPAAERALRAHGFAVVPGQADGFASAYSDLRSKGHALFITGDSALYATAAVLDRTFMFIEEGPLYDRLLELSREMARLTEEQYLVAADAVAKEAARRNLAFFAVGTSLLDPDYFPPEFVASLVERELGLIERGRDTAFSPIMGATPLDGVVGPGEDYSNYVPPTRYERSGRLSRFYRAATWYGRMAFALPEGRVEDYGLTMQAALVARALDSGAGEWLELWERVYDPLAFFVGDSGDPTVREYVEVSHGVFGEEFELEAVADEEAIAAFAQAVAEIAPPHFETHELRGMRFLPRRYFADVRYFHRLASSDARDLPTSLDLMALLGSRTAREVLEEADAYADDVYRLGFEEIEDELTAMTYGDWTRDLYWSWLYAISALVSGPSAGGPPYASGEAWDARELAAGAAGWALLRSDWTRSAAESPHAEAVPEPPAPPVVEACPELYARLADLVEHVRDELLEHYLLEPEIDAVLAGQVDFLRSLEAASRSGSLGSSPGDISVLGAYDEFLSGLLGPGPDRMEASAFAAAAYRDPVSGHLLEVAVGAPDIVYVLTSEGGSPVLRAGAVFSFYEFERASPEEVAGLAWPKLVRGGVPDRPIWASRYLSE